MDYMNEQQTTLNYEVIINADAQKVWNTTFYLPSYEQWAAIFDPSSTYIGNFDKGTEIKFTSKDNKGGMIGTVVENTPYDLVAIDYFGVMANGSYDLDDRYNEIIKGVREDYTFTKISDTQTKLSIKTVTLLEWSDFLESTWPQALDKLKSMCEA
jgi:hypothetical protein